MGELLIGAVLIVLIIKYSSAIKHTAQAADAKSTAWALDVKNTAVKDIAALTVDEDDVSKANTNINRLNQLKL